MKRTLIGFVDAEACVAANPKIKHSDIMQHAAIVCIKALILIPIKFHIVITELYFYVEVRIRFRFESMLVGEPSISRVKIGDAYHEVGNFPSLTVDAFGDAVGLKIIDDITHHLFRSLWGFACDNRHDPR